MHFPTKTGLASPFLLLNNAVYLQETRKVAPIDPGIFETWLNPWVRFLHCWGILILLKDREAPPPKCFVGLKVEEGSLCPSE